MINNYCKIWVSKVIESPKLAVGTKGALFASVLKFGLVPDIFISLFFHFKGAFFGIDYLFALLLATIWLNIGPFLIWYYDERLLPSFFQKVKTIISDPERLSTIARKYDHFFAKRYWLVSIPWTVLLIYIYLNFIQMTNSPVFGFPDPLFWLSLIIVTWGGWISGIGFIGVLTTMLALREISKEQIKVEPLHIDKLGGLGTVGYYAVGTTLLFSSGSLFLPFGAEATILSKGQANILILAGFSIYSLFVLLSFLYPTAIINSKAKKERDQILEGLRKRIKETRQTIEKNCTGIDRMVCFSELEALRNEYADYREVRLYPFEINIIVKLISSILLPIGLAVIQLYLPSILNLT